MLEIDPEQLLTRAELAEALTLLGYPISKATIATKAGRGGGPPYRIFGPRAASLGLVAGMGAVKTRAARDLDLTTRCSTRALEGAVMSAAEIARSLGGARRSGRWWRCPCPAHSSRGPTLSIRDGDRGLVAVCHAGCSRPDIFTELRRRGLLAGDADGARPDSAEIERRRDAEARDRHRRIALARDIIASARSAAATVVERYLKMRVSGLVSVPQAIRYLPMGDAYSWHPSGGRRPVMVAAVEHVDHGIVGAHRTWLAVDGSAKASFDPVRKSSGPVGGGAVRLGQAAETTLIAEGIETTLAGMVATGLPGWAALSTSGLKTLRLPPIVRHVVISADHDESGAGEREAQTAAIRWRTEGRKVSVHIRIGEDAADLLLAAL